MIELPHLHSAWDVDRHIVLDSADKLVAIRFSSYEHPPTEALKPYLNAQPEENVIYENTSNKQQEESTDVEESHRKKAKVEQSSGNNNINVLLSTSSFTQNNMSGITKINTISTRENEVAGMEHYVSTQHMDAMLLSIAPKVRKYCVIYAVNTNEVSEFNEMYELGHERDPFALMFFYRNQHIKVDVGTGNNNKINFFAFDDNNEVIEIINAAFRAGKLGKNMTSTERTYSTVSVKR